MRNSIELQIKLLRIIFQDVADGDNLLAIYNYILKNYPTIENPIHIVLSLRSDDFRIPKFAPGQKFPGVIPDKSLRTNNTEDMELSGKNSARRILMFLHAAGVGDTLAHTAQLVKIYNGGYPEQVSNLSHRLHAHDGFFDCLHILTDDINDMGKLVTKEQYNDIIKIINGTIVLDSSNNYDITQEPLDLQENRRLRVREYMTTAVKHAETIIDGVLLKPLDDILQIISKNTLPIDVELLAPFTGLMNIFKQDISKNFYAYLRRIHGQFGAWDNCKATTKNIFKNPFNMDCDTIAVNYVLEALLLCGKLEYVMIVPTEISKSAEQMEPLTTLYNTLLTVDFNSIPLFMRLWFQWSHIKGSVQPIFDQAVGFFAEEMNACKESVPPMTLVKVNFTTHSGSNFDNWDRDVYEMIQVDESSPTKFRAISTINNGWLTTKTMELLNSVQNK